MISCKSLFKVNNRRKSVDQKLEHLCALKGREWFISLLTVWLKKDVDIFTSAMLSTHQLYEDLLPTTRMYLHCYISRFSISLSFFHKLEESDFNNKVTFILSSFIYTWNFLLRVYAMLSFSKDHLNTLILLCFKIFYAKKLIFLVIDCPDVLLKI